MIAGTQKEGDRMPFKVGRPSKKAPQNVSGQTALITDNDDFTDIPVLTGEAQMKRATGYEAYPMLAEGENTKYLSVIIETEKIAQTADRNDIDSLYNCLNSYLQLCHKYDVKLTNMGLYRACNLAREEIDRWAAGTLRSSNPEYRNFANLCRAICSEYREIIMAEGKLNPITGIWWQKNYDRFQDKPQPYGSDMIDEKDELTSAEIAEKYQDIPDE